MLAHPIEKQGQAPLNALEIPARHETDNAKTG